MIIIGSHNIYDTEVCEANRRRNMTSKSIVAKQLAHAQLSSAPRSKWSQYRVNGLLTGVKIKRDPVTSILYNGE